MKKHLFLLDGLRQEVWPWLPHVPASSALTTKSQALWLEARAGEDALTVHSAGKS